MYATHFWAWETPTTQLSLDSQKGLINNLRGLEQGLF